VFCMIISYISLLQTLAKLCLDNISAMSDFYNLTVKHIIDLPASRLKDIKKVKLAHTRLPSVGFRS